MPLDIIETHSVMQAKCAESLPCGSFRESHSEIKSVTSWGGARVGAGRPRKSIPVLDVVGRRWFCIQTHSRREDEAFAGLRLAGFDACYPRERAERITRQQRVEIVRPLFPRYLFVQLDLAENWRPAASIRGVQRIFGATPERPTPVPVGVVEALQIRCGVDGVIDSRPDGLRLVALQVGDRVRLLEGPFRDLEAVCQMAAADRVRVLLRVLGGRDVPVTVPREAVELVA